MAWRAFIFSGLFASGVGAAAVRAEAWPVRGEVAGEVRIEALAGLDLGWRAEFAAGELVLRATRPGVELAIAARPERDGPWSWRVTSGALDLAELWPLARAWAGEAAAGWSASGRVELAGAGRWDPATGPTGEVLLRLREGWARSETLGVEVSGIELDVFTTDLAGGALPAGQTLRVARISTPGAEVAGLRLGFGLTAARVVEVADGGARLFGGELKLRPFKVAMDAPVLTAGAEVNGLQLAEVARLMPWLIDSAGGKLRGRVEFGWDAVKGLRVRDGALDIVKSDDAVFRLAPSPGLLTGGMEDKFRFFPNSTWWRWVGINNPAYAPLKAIEQGRDGLRLETFRVTFWPDGPGRGRPATIHIVGKPTSGRLVEEVRMDVNFHGPLTEALAFGLNQDLGGFQFKLD